MNQIEATITKAAWGRGWPHGLAEDCGRATAWLAARGLDGVGAALAAISPGPTEPEIDEASDAVVFQAAQAIRAGPSAFDLLASDLCTKRIVLQGIDQPLLLIGFGCIAATSYGSTYRITFANACQAIVDGSVVRITGTLPSSGIDAIIETETLKQDLCTSVPIDMEIDDSLWQSAQEMAAESYVASSRCSRELGAGAGLVDDD